jgi:hypothetical protein
MGMDLLGLDAIDEKGQYFRNNVWWWRILYEYCVDFHLQYLGEDPEHGYYNSGYTINNDNATKLGLALLQDLKNGKVTKYKNEYYKYVSNLPREHCDICDGTGIRTDQVGLDMQMPEKKLDSFTAGFTNRTHGWCNGCEGIGTTTPFEANYCFDEENVENFAKFCLASGGFEIC